MMTNFTYSIEEYLGSYTARLALSPESKEIYTYDTGDNSMPVNIWHQRHINFMSLPLDFSKESLIEFLKSEEVQKILEKIMGTYQGEGWDGSNTVGVWESTDGKPLDIEYYRDELEGMSHSIKCYWKPHEFCEDDIETAEIIGGEKDAFKAAEKIVDAAFDCDILLNQNDVVSWLREDENRHLLEGMY
jgi:hypothetical protein